MAFSDYQVGSKYTVYDDSPGSTHNLVVDLVRPGSRVLEFGCATGYMSAVLRNRLNATVTGVEVNAEAAEEARAHCERVIVGDAEELDLETDLAGERFDVILFADVLEHLRDPAGLLRRVRPLLDEGGTVIASIPNVAHASLRLALLSGSFRYRETGLLDDTHLRFFTHEGIRDLFEGSGFVVTHWLRRRLEIEDSEIPVPSGIPEEARAWVAADPEATTYQFVVAAVPADTASQLLAWRTTAEEARSELEELRLLRQRGDEQARELEEELLQLRRAHEVLQRRIVAERVAFAEGIAAVQADVYSSRSWRYTAPMRGFFGLLRHLRP